jgi:2-methylcitrate dehydratase PrpD
MSTHPFDIHAGGVETHPPEGFMWPGNKKIAVVFRMAYEWWSDGHWSGIGPMGNPLKGGIPDLNAVGWAEYGHRRGVGRVLEVFDRHKVKASILVRRNFGTMTMSMHSGIAASNGIRAAQLAQKGFTGDPEIFDGAMSLGDVFSREWSPDLLDKNLDLWGKPFMIVSPGATFKLYPCGRPPLFAVDCALAIQEKHHIPAENIKKIYCDVSFLYPRTLIHTNPKNGLQAKASLQYCIATSLLDGPPTLASFSDENVNRDSIKNLIGRIEVRVPPHLSEDIPAVRKAPFEQPVTLEVHTKDGKIYSETVPIHKGSPLNPASDADLKKKFIGCAKLHMNEKRADQVLVHIANQKNSVRELMQLIKV